jgi:hypothetical protein
MVALILLFILPIPLHHHYPWTIYSLYLLALYEQQLIVYFASFLVPALAHLHIPTYWTLFYISIWMSLGYRCLYHVFRNPITFFANLEGNSMPCTSSALLQAPTGMVWFGDVANHLSC